MANDFMKWRMRTSFRLLGIPQRKNNTVTRIKGANCPAGNSAWRCADPGDTERGSGDETFMLCLSGRAADPSDLTASRELPRELVTHDKVRCRGRVALSLMRRRDPGPCAPKGRAAYKLSQPSPSRSIGSARRLSIR